MIYYHCLLQIDRALNVVKVIITMVKLVGVIGGEDKKTSEGAETRPVCLARRQFPLVIEPELTMIMALDDSCLACGARAGANKHRDASDWNFFLRNYRR